MQAQGGVSFISCTIYPFWFCRPRQNISLIMLPPSSPLYQSCNFPWQKLNNHSPLLNSILYMYDSHICITIWSKSWHQQFIGKEGNHDSHTAALATSIFMMSHCHIVTLHTSDSGLARNISQPKWLYDHLEKIGTKNRFYGARLLCINYRIYWQRSGG